MDWFADSSGLSQELKFSAVYSIQFGLIFKRNFVNKRFQLPLGTIWYDLNPNKLFYR